VGAISNLPEGMTFVAEASGIEEYRMANGMKILLYRQAAAPVVTFMVLYHVGSRNEAVGHTGATHLLEHMLFKGTPTFNAERGTQIATALHRLGAIFNATTWYDRTNYFEAVPREHLEFVVQLEADRMRNALIRDEDREPERIVVRNELERGENEPLMVLEIRTWATAFREHPYHHPTIGWRSDVENVPTERLREFYDTFYWPNNATALVVGDFDRQAALGLLQKYFGVIPASPHPIPEVYTAEPPQEGERRFVVRRAGEVGALMLAYHIPAAKHPDIYPLAVLARIMADGVTTRLYQRLVDGELAISVRANAFHLRDPALFEITSVLRPDIQHEKVERAIREEIARLRDESVNEQELARARNKIKADTFYSRDGALNAAMTLGEAEASADWQWFIDYVTNIEKVTTEDVQRVARHYFHDDNLTVGWFVPRNSQEEDVVGRQSLVVNEKPATNDQRPKTHDRGVVSSDQGSETRNQSRSFAERTERVVFPNGLRLLILENRANPTVEIEAVLNGGKYFDPKDKPQLSSLTASMLMRGTTRRTKLEIAQVLEDVGAEVRIRANRFLTTVTASLLAQDLDRVLQILAEILRHPSFPQDELEKLKQQMIGQIRRNQENTRIRALDRFLQLTFDPSNPFYEWSAEDRIASIEAITPEDLKRFHSEHYGPGSMVLVVVGDVDAVQAKTEVERLLGDWTGGEATEFDVPRTLPEAEPRREVILMPDKASVDIILGHAGGLRRTDDDYFAALIANAALGHSTLSSRLGLRVRDQEGLSYHIISRFLEPSFADGPWIINVTVNPENVDRAIEVALEVLNMYLIEGITERELEDEKSAFIGSFIVGLGTNGGIASQLLSAERFGFGPQHLDEIPRLVQAITLEQVNAAMRKYLHPERLLTVIAGEYNA